MSLNPLSNKKLLILIVTTAIAAACAPYHSQRGATSFHQRGKASWYGPGFAGRKTANGERFNPNALTAAHRKLPFGTTVKVTNVDNGKSVVVRINDRGPYAGNRVIDLSKAAAKRIGLISSGVGVVEIRALGAAAKPVAKPRLLLASRGGRVRKNGVEHLISVETKDDPAEPEPVAREAEPEPTPKAVAKMNPPERAPAPYSVDDEPF